MKRTRNIPTFISEMKSVYWCSRNAFAMVQAKITRAVGAS